MSHLSIDIKRGSETVITVKPDNTSNQSKRIMGDNLVSLTFELNKMVNFKIGDTADIFGETYSLNKMPVVTKRSLYNYEYSLVMQSLQYDLINAQYMFYDANNVLQEGDFSLTGTAQTFVDLIVTNINRVSSGWTRGIISLSQEYKTLTFSKEDCFSVLQKIAAEFGTEYYIENRTINLATQATQTGYKFRYGKGKGLYDITRTQPDNQRIITRLYAFGAEKNLPYDYPSSRLRLPGGYDNLVHNVEWEFQGTFGNPRSGDYGTVYTFSWTNPLSGITKIGVEYRLQGASNWHEMIVDSQVSTGIPMSGIGVFEVRFKSYRNDVVVAATPIVLVSDTSTAPAFTQNNALPYLEENTNLYGIREGDFITDDIYPHRTGKVTAVDALNIYKFTDTLLDFDINGYLLPNTTAKVTFVTGQLSGYAFDILSYNHGTKQITILKNKAEKVLDIPNNVLKPAIGDSYVLTDISMPASYVQAAEDLLKAKAQEYLNLNSSPSYQYSITCDPAYFRLRNIKMDIGNIVWLQDTELDIDKYIRVVGVTKSLLDEYEYTLELGEAVSQGTIAQLTTTTSSNTTQITNTQRALEQNKLLNGINIGDLKIEQGTLIIANVPSNIGTPLKIDAQGRLCI